MKSKNLFILLLVILTLFSVNAVVANENNNLNLSYGDCPISVSDS